MGLSVDTGHSAVVFHRKMAAPIMSYAIWTGKYLLWEAEQWTEGPGRGGTWGVTDGLGRPVPDSVKQALSPAPHGFVLDDLNGHLFFFENYHELEEWTGKVFAPVGPVADPRVNAAGEETP